MTMPGHCNISDGESRDALGGKSDTAHDESHLLQHFMESMIQQYTSLVEDLSTELYECQEYIKRYVNSEPSETRSEDKYVSLEAQLHRKDAMIANLQTQLQISLKASATNKHLWQTCISQLETLETQKSQVEEELKARRQKPPQEVRGIPGINGNGCQHVSSLSSDFLTKWKLLQAYSENLESRLAKSVSEKNFYRSKMLDVRFEFETALKRQAVEKSREVEHVKISYVKEIEYLKSCVEKLRQHNKSAWEKRLGAEKENWEYEENKRLQSLKIQVENLIMENELLRQKQLQFVSIVRSMNIGNIGIGIDERGGKNQQHADVDVVQAQSPSQFISRGPHKKYKSVQTDLHGSIISADQVHRMKTSQHHLELEYKRILVQLDFTEASAQSKTINLEERIQQLESLNAHLHDQILELNEANVKLLSHSGACSDLPESQRVPPPQLISPLLMEKPSWSKPDDFLIQEKHRVDRSMWKLNMSAMEDEIMRHKTEKEQLISMVEKQQKIVNKWKAEVKGLVRKSIQVVTAQDQDETNNNDNNTLSFHSLLS